MGLIEKLEILINKLLIALGDLLIRACLKLLPPPVIAFFNRLTTLWALIVLRVKTSPAYLKENLPLLIGKSKTLATNIDLKSTLSEASKLAKEKYSSGLKDSKIPAWKKTLLTPFILFGIWLKGLSSSQSLLLLVFTGASILSVINIAFSGNRIMTHQVESRSPASVEEEITYDRPGYYKKQTRHMQITNLRLPVYFANTNDLRTIDIDFSATLSNRLARMKLEKLEFQLRDHLILNVEPMETAFPLEDEGKAILKEKLQKEIDEFLIRQKIEGSVKDVKIIYILAN